MASRPEETPEGTEEEARLLADLVALPTLSGQEAPAVEHVARWCAAAGLSASIDDSGVIVECGGDRPGPTLALSSHLDVVPAGEGWTRAPFDPSIHDGHLYGRGSGDAKASVAAMLLAARDAAAARIARGRLLVLLSLGEESTSPTMPRLVARAGTIDAAVVGEPTSLDLAVAQRGLLIAELRARGEQRHAAHPPSSAGASSAIETLARDLVRLDGLFAGKTHPELGRTVATPTQVHAGVARNVIPAEAVATLDVRTTPDWTHAQALDELRAALASRVEVVSDRLVPCATPADSRLLPHARRLLPHARLYGSPTCSDWVFLRHTDAIKCGPGDSRRSHGPDERVRIGQVGEARQFYAALAKRYLS